MQMPSSDPALWNLQTQMKHLLSYDMVLIIIKILMVTAQKLLNLSISNDKNIYSYQS